MRHASQLVDPRRDLVPSRNSGDIASQGERASPLGNECRRALTVLSLDHQCFGSSIPGLAS